MRCNAELLEDNAECVVNRSKYIIRCILKRLKTTAHFWKSFDTASHWGLSLLESIVMSWNSSPATSEVGASLLNVTDAPLCHASILLGCHRDRWSVHFCLQCTFMLLWLSYDVLDRRTCRRQSHVEVRHLLRRSWRKDWQWPATLGNLFDENKARVNLKKRRLNRWSSLTQLNYYAVQRRKRWIWS